MRLFITPAFAAHWPYQEGDQQQVEENDHLTQHIVHQVERRQLSNNRPEVKRQQRKTNTHNLATPVAGLFRRHAKMTNRHAIFFQHLPAQTKHQPEDGHLLAERPQQVADIQLHSQQNQTYREDNQARRQGSDEIDQNRFWRVELTIITQVTHRGG